MSKIFSAQELGTYITDRFGHDAPRIIAQANTWLARGDGIAVYENCDLGAMDVGAPKLVSFGTAQAALATDAPPANLPDTPQDINWRYLLYGRYRGDELTVPAADVLGIPAERNPRRVSYTCALDNYEPVPRKVEYGSFIAYDDDTETSGQPRYMRDLGESAIPAQSVFIIDDGKTAHPYFSSGTNPRTNTEILTPFPVNPDGKLRPDGRVIDYSSWMLGPCKMYHLKITR